MTEAAHGGAELGKLTNAPPGANLSAHRVIRAGNFALVTLNWLLGRTPNKGLFAVLGGYGPKPAGKWQKVLIAKHEIAIVSHSSVAIALKPFVPLPWRRIRY